MRGVHNSLFLALLIFCSCGSRQQNHLSQAASPYLKEHADNPVNWFEWGDEALQLAKKNNKPLLISIGYSACHWCHVMEKESFMDTAVARVMNENFICIKVDREERPDLDNIYSSACQLISGNAGWPLNAFALPDGKPFFAGTYYSKQSWLRLLYQVAAAYKQQKNKVELQASSLADGIAQLEISALGDSSNAIGNADYENFFENLYKRMDVSWGGLNGTPKFPIPSSLDFLLQYYFITKDKRALNAATTTLVKMASGGIYDQVGGGFSRYSIDSMWHIPHFEKMLYDNAQLISLYTHAWQITKNNYFKTVAQETIDFIKKDLANSSGGYNSSVNADTKDDEGAYYTWTYDELKKNIPDRYPIIADYYHVTENGNWKEDKNILFTADTPAAYAQKNKIDPDSFFQLLLTTKQKLSGIRNKRPRPSVDNKVLTSWNALFLQSLLDAYAAFGEKAYLQDALSLARFIETKMMRHDGGLWRYLKKEQPSVVGFLDDYALLANAFTRMYQLTFDKHWLINAKTIVDYAITNFYDKPDHMFFYSAKTPDNTIIRKIEITDNSLPSSNASMAKVLYLLGVYFDSNDYTDIAGQMLSKMNRQLLGKEASYYTSWASLAGALLYGTNEVVIVGNKATETNLSLQKNYLPLAIFAGSSGEENLPLLEGKKTDTATLIYVCLNKTCKRPVKETEKALKQLSVIKSM